MKSKKYPPTTDPRFTSKIQKLFMINEEEEGTATKSIKKLCNPAKNFEYQSPQKFLRRYIGPGTPYRGLLLFHKIGSGKTCTAITIAEAWKGKRKAVVVLPASLVENFKNELRSPCAGEAYMTGEERQLVALHGPHRGPGLQAILESDRRIAQHYTILSYHAFLKKRVQLTKSILIVDEIQNMVSDAGVFYEHLKQRLDRAPPDLRIVLLSATPMMDRAEEIALTLNLLPLPKPLPTGPAFEDTFLSETKAINLDVFKQMVQGFVSYYGGMPAKTFPRANVFLVRCPMLGTQTKKYKKTLTGKDPDASNDFFLASRMASNVALPFRASRPLAESSCKIAKLIKRLKKNSKSFIYSNFLGDAGLKTVAKVLDKHGWQDYRYYRGGNGKSRCYAMWSGDESPKYREEVRHVFNTTGSCLKIILGSPAVKEGVSFKNVRQVHILEPYWNMSRIEQIQGRAIRFCSHVTLPPKQRSVDVYLYMATTEGFCIDEYMYELAQKKHRLIQQFEKALKDAAIEQQFRPSPQSIWQKKRKYWLFSDRAFKPKHTSTLFVNFSL